jgi:hypothetical protein
MPLCLSATPALRTASTWPRYALCGSVVTTSVILSQVLAGLCSVFLTLKAAHLLSVPAGGISSAEEGCCVGGAQYLVAPVPAPHQVATDSDDGPTQGAAHARLSLPHAGHSGASTGPCLTTDVQPAR